ncbi:hypothetical protein [Sediminibacterium sp.]|uniref:hypothetical protein n=1 Tax=Sediminibacterium sp. TaxID=1917865 RepID=UPI0025E3F765|nr:hypothetical protein [Sediminibacterium sp.]MBW0177572.1 hypothetical protein [Sediminibacterium sp.]
MQKTGRKLLLFICFLFVSVSIGTAQVVNSSAQVYTSGDGIFWHLTGTGNGPAILLKQNTYQGGAINRRGSLSWMDNSANKTEVLSWTDALNVGIGISDPAFKLDINGGLRIRNSQENMQDYTTFRIQGGNTLAHGLEIDFFGDPSRTSLPGTYYAGYGGGAIVNVNDKPLVFGTANTSRMHISGIGNVGIGTNNPLHQLHISGGDIAFDAEQQERFIRINNSFGGAIRFRGNAVSSLDRSLQFGRFDGNNNWAALMTVETNNGNVGIGTIFPAHKLDISAVSEEVSLRVGTTNTGSNAASFILSNSSQNAFNDGIKIIHGAGVTKFNDLSGTTQMSIDHTNAKIGIGTVSPSEKLSVNGNIRAKKIIVSQTSWPDYVFDSSYSLRSIKEVEKFITKNKHLPEMPSAKEVEEKGISVGDNQALLLKKIEELTLYVIDLQKQINELKKNTSNK